MKKTLDDLPAGALKGSTVAVRVDFNVPLTGGEVGDPTRIDRTIPTLLRLVEAGARIVLLSHLGRPKGQVDPASSLAPVARYLGNLLATPVSFLPTSVGPSVASTISLMPSGGVLLLENTRFLPGETENDPALARQWAAWADHFVMDAFGTAHRAHASTDGLPRAVVEKGGLAVAGLLMERELRFLGGALASPERPFVAVLGGAKISGKIDVIEALLPLVDSLLIGGAMANTFFSALGLEVGSSLVEPEKVDVAGELMARAAERIVLPVDCVVGDRIQEGVTARVTDRATVKAHEAIGDIGPTSVALFGEYIRQAATVLWNGPMGVFELGEFSGGTFGVANACAAAAAAGTTVIIGGGDSAAAAEAAGVAESMTHISTGGGASLELLAGKALPGVEALSEKASP